MITHLFADVDYTLTTFPAERAYSEAEGSMNAYLSGIGLGLSEPYRQFNELFDGNIEVRRTVERVFESTVAVPEGRPQEMYWSRFAAFSVLIAHHSLKERLCGSKDLDDRAAVKAEFAFWSSIAMRACLYEDAVRLLKRAKERGATVQPLTSSDVRCLFVEKPVAEKIVYVPRVSAAAKLARIVPLLQNGHSEVAPPYVFERFGKTNARGWMPLRHKYPDVSPGRCAMVGDSPSDVEAGSMMGMRVRILLNRESRHADRTCRAATHVVTTLEDVPDILGW